MVPFLPEGEAQVLFYDPARSVLELDPDSSEMQAVRVACAPWHLMSQEGARLEADTLDVNEQDPDNRILLKPLLDEEWKVIGVAGMIIDLAFFRDTYLPQVVHESLQKHMPEGGSLSPYVMGAAHLFCRHSRLRTRTMKSRVCSGLSSKIGS